MIETARGRTIRLELLPGKANPPEISCETGAAGPRLRY